MLVIPQHTQPAEDNAWRTIVEQVLFEWSDVAVLHKLRKGAVTLTDVALLMGLFWMLIGNPSACTGCHG
jgi:hypothetical protein